MDDSRRGRATFLVAALLLAACSGGESGSSRASGSGDGTTTSAADTTDDTAAEPDPGGGPDSEGSGSESFEQIDHGPLAVTIPPVEPVAVFTIDGTSGDGGEGGEQVLLPSDLLEVVRRGVDAGSFSEAEGLVRALDGISGRAVPTPGLGPADAIEPGVTALTRRAADLLRDDELAGDDRARLTAALRPFTPSQDLLDAISEPAPGPTAGFANASLRAPARVGEPGATSAAAGPTEIIASDCFDIFANGVSTDTDLDTGDACFHYVEATVDGHDLRVYYSSTWQTDPDRLELVGIALDALVTSTGIFAGLATVGPINAVFSLGSSPTALAQQSYFDLAEPCPITVFTSAFAGSSDAFRQTIAHEVFHCVQDRSFTTVPYQTHKWWLEGSAEYFSNVVYPSVNDEHQWTRGFDVRSLNEDLTLMAYENTVFFQYYSNIRGDAATIELLRSVSAAGATVGSIGSVAGMDRLWRDFVVAGLADEISDTGGGTVGALFMLQLPRIMVDGVQAVALPTSPMRAARYVVRYVKQKRYEQTIDEAQTLVAAWANEYTDITAWTEMPVEVRPTCDKNRTYIIVSTTVGEPLTPTANVDTAEQAVCDPCLLGTWELRLGSFGDYITTLVTQEGGAVPGMTLLVDGSYVFEFEANGRLSSDKDVSVGAVLEGIAAAPTTRVTGAESGRYDADGTRLIVTGWQGDSTATLGSASSSVFSGPESQGTGYTCEDDVLTFTSLPYGPLVFDLVDPPPAPPPIIVETGG